MVTEVNKNTFASVYKDDFRDSDNYHRILFNSGRSLQARELTQMQTIIQRELARLGNHIFKDGATVNPISGGVDPNRNYAFIKLDPSSNDFDGLTTEQLVGRYFVGSVSSVKIRVLEAISANATDPATIYVKYEQTPDANYSVAAVSETLTEIATGKELIVAAADATGFGVQVNVAGGDFYAAGHFIFAPPQSIIVDKYNNLNVSANIGYIVREEIVDELDDDALYDNQGVNPNRAAPGADRYRIRLELATEASVGPNDQFVKFFELVNAVPKNVKTGIEDYNKPADFLAERTREAEGDFLVSPFLIKFLPGDSAGRLFLDVNDFVAYVDGYRVKGGTVNSTKEAYSILKPTSTTASSEYASTTLTTRINLRNYIELDSATGLSNYNGDLLDKVNLYDGSNNVIGTTRVMQYEYVNDRYFAYLFQTNLNDGESFRSIHKIGNSTTNYITPLNAGATALEDAGGVNLFVPLYRDRVASVSNVQFEVMREVAVVANASNQVIISSDNDEPFEDTDNWIIIDATNNTMVDTQVVTFTDSGGGLTPYQMTITGGGITNGRNYKVIYIVNKSVANYISKTLATSTVSSGALVTDSSGLNFVELNGDIDIYELDSVKDSANGLIDLRSSFRLENGNRDNGYYPGRLILTAPSLPVSNVYAKYKHFNHGSGDYYSISSYSGLVADSAYSYADIPVHVTNTNRAVRLADVLDFRSTYDRAGNVVNEVEVPKNASNLFYDFSSYNSRVDVLVANKDGTVYVKRGQESLSPKKPDINTPSELPLYYFKLNGNTLGPGDLIVNQIPHKRFSMKSITRLEERVDRLEEAVSLSLLETKTKDLVIQATNGAVRVKSGFLVDNFHYFPQLVASQTGPNYDEVNPTQSIDRIRSVIYPKSSVDKAELLYDSANSSNVILRGDTVFLNHREDTPVYKHEVITNPKNVNPFLIREVLGTLTLSPNDDTWVDTKNLPDNILADVTSLNPISLNGDTSWADGYSADQFADGASVGVLDVSESITDTTDGSFVSDPVRIRHRTNLTTTVFTTTTERTKVTDRVTDVTSVTSNVGNTTVVYTLPFMRQKKVYFRGQALRPNTRHYPYFNGVPVDQWCREEATFFRADERPEEDDLYDETSPYLEEHPAGRSELVTDLFGEIIGSFFIPNTGLAPKVGGIQSYTGYQPTATFFNNGLTEYDAAFAAAVQRASGSLSGVEAAKSPAIFNAVGWRFRADGNPTPFELLDTSRYLPGSAFSRASASYTANAGNRTTEQRNMQTTTTVTIEREEETWEVTEVTGIQNQITTDPHDPLAQTFYVYDKDFPQGMFVNSVDIFIRRAPTTADEQIPIVMELREVRNGIPVTTPGPFTVKSAADIRTAINADANTGVSSYTTEADVLANPVKFSFDEPVFLKPGNYYAIVIKADTDKYQAWISTVGEYRLGSADKRANGQNITGSLFESQNASTWSPLQNSDMAYRINHLKFVPSGTVRFTNKKLPRKTFGYDNPLKIDSASNRLIVNDPGHGFFAGDHPQIQGLVDSSRYAGILGSTIMNPDLSIDSADAMGYTLILDSASTQAAEFGDADVSTVRNVLFDKFKITFSSQVTPDRTTILPSIKLLSGQSYASSVDQRFNLSPTFMKTELDKAVLLPSPKMVLNDSAETATPYLTSGTIVKAAGTPGKSLSIDLDISAKETTLALIDSAETVYTRTVSPTVNISDAMAVLTHYMIDNQDSVASPGSLINTAVDYVSETNPLSGSTPSKHITKPVIIREPAIGLKILFDAYRPPEANFDVYYRTCLADEDIYKINWTLVNPVEGGYPAPNQIVSSIQQMQYAEYEYFVGDETGVTPADDITTFTQYQVKIVMKSTNTSRFPSLSNVRIISLVT